MRRWPKPLVSQDRLLTEPASHPLPRGDRHRPTPSLRAQRSNLGQRAITDRRAPLGRFATLAMTMRVKKAAGTRDRSKHDGLSDEVGDNVQHVLRLKRRECRDRFAELNCWLYSKTAVQPRGIQPFDRANFRVRLTADGSDTALSDVTRATLHGDLPSPHRDVCRPWRPRKRPPPGHGWTVIHPGPDVLRMRPYPRPSGPASRAPRRARRPQGPAPR